VSNVQIVCCLLSIYYLILKLFVIIDHWFLNTFSAWAYKMTKSVGRQPVVQWLIDNKEKDLDFVIKFMQSSGVQKSLGLYLQSLKK